MALTPSTLPLESLRVLAACVRHGNFSRAADELAITPTAVSQRMRALEELLGVKLFGRHGPRLIVTDRAAALAAGVEQALALLRSAVDDCLRAPPPLRVTCAPTFAACWLVQRLAAYQALPGADAIALDAGQGLSPAGSFDVAIRSGSGSWPGYRATRLLAEQGTPMLSPRLLPTGECTVDKLLSLPLIPDPRWPAWCEAAGRPGAKPGFVTTRFPNYELEARAAVQGLGVALLSPLLFADLCERGELVAPFASTVVQGPDSYWLLAPADAPASHFEQWLRACFPA